MNDEEKRELAIAIADEILKDKRPSRFRLTCWKASAKLCYWLNPLKDISKKVNDT